MSTATVTAPISDGLTATHERTEYVGFERQWDDYTLSFTYRGKTHEVATLTQYPNGRAMLVRSIRVRNTVQWARWFNLVRLWGFEPEMGGQVMYVWEGAR